MISWIVASHRPDIFQSHLGPSLKLQDEDELVLIENETSITRAYYVGQKKATQPVKVYVHHDIRITNYAALRTELINNVSTFGIVGVIGSRTPVLPWWNGAVLGSVIDVRLGQLHFGPGGLCSIIDGILIATQHHIDWDLDAPGWHGYDHDACLKMLAAGHLNYCINNGHTMLAHYASSPTSLDAAVGWHECVNWYRDSWDTLGRKIASFQYQNPT